MHQVLQETQVGPQPLHKQDFLDTMMVALAVVFFNQVSLVYQQQLPQLQFVLKSVEMAADTHPLLFLITSVMTEIPRMETVVRGLARLRLAFNAFKEVNRTEMFVQKYAELAHLTTVIILAMTATMLMATGAQTIVLLSRAGLVGEGQLQVMMSARLYAEMGSFMEQMYVMT